MYMIEREVINMKEFENGIVENFTYKSRFIASWTNVGGSFKTRSDRNNFKKWLLSIGVGEDDSRDILNLATNGKLEYEYSAEEFLKNI